LIRFLKVAKKYITFTLQNKQELMNYMFIEHLIEQVKMADHN